MRIGRWSLLLPLVDGKSIDSHGFWVSEVFMVWLCCGFWIGVLGLLVA